jgi:hypothetical protein
MAEPTPLTDTQLLAEFKRLIEEAKTNATEIAKQTAKGVVDSALIEAKQKIEADIAALAAKVDADLRSIKQRTSRPPGAAPEDEAYYRQYMTIGQQFTDSEQYKACTFSGRYKIGASMKSPIRIKGSILGGPAPVAPGGVIQAPGSGGTPTPLVAPPAITEGTSGLYIFPRRVAWVQPPMFPMVMRDLLDVVPLTGTNAVEYVTEVWTNNVDYQATEGTRKAQSGVAYTDKTAPVRTIAHFVKVSRQMLNDVPFVQTSIDQRLVYQVLYKEDKEILYGDNSAGHLNGIKNQATAYVAPPAIATAVTTQIDAVLAAMTQCANNGYVPTAIVLNPTDWAGMNLAKTTYGSYILEGPMAMANRTLWGLPVMVSFNMVSLDFLVGAFPGNGAIFDREAAVVEISFENEDDFVNNLATIRCEERVALALWVPAAFIWGNFGALPALAATTAGNGGATKKG